MTTIITYICDRCQEQVTKADIFQVGYLVSQAAYNTMLPQPISKGDWCRVCCEELHLHTDRPFKGEHVPTVSEKLEEIIRTIVKEAIEDQS